MDMPPPVGSDVWILALQLVALFGWAVALLEEVCLSLGASFEVPNTLHHSWCFFCFQCVVQNVRVLSVCRGHHVCCLMPCFPATRDSSLWNCKPNKPFSVNHCVHAISSEQEKADLHSGLQPRGDISIGSDVTCSFRIGGT